MTIAEQLHQEGEQRGLEKGKQAGLMEGLVQGEQKGEQQGLYKAAIAIAKNMLAKGLDIDLIQSTTNLSEEEIKKLIN